jgi:uncharacterized phage protein (TIGR02218 family)
MTFDTSERSQSGSQPIELYEFTYQGNHLRYTSADRDITISGVTYTHEPINRSNVQEGGDIAKQDCQLNCRSDFDVSELFNPYPPDDVIGLVIKRVQLSALSPDQEAVLWIGRVLSASWPQGQSQLTCQSTYTALKTAGLRRIYSRNCPHVLYGAMCKANILAFQQAMTLDNQVGNVLNAANLSSHPDGWWAGGKVSWEAAPGLVLRRGIKNHVGTHIEVTYPFPNIPAGAAITVAPGCDHTFPTCDSKFANTDNYGGFPFMTQKNPFGQASVF